jgi:ubiquitin-protein ligase
MVGMIAFVCPHCQKAFNVPDSYAGRKARCKGCRSELRVPAAVVREAAVASKPPLRVRRLMSDAELMRSTFARHPAISIDATTGDPPDLYRVRFLIKSLARDAKGRIVDQTEHFAEMQLGADYPRMPPVCRMLTPVFHPNINEQYICIGDHWTAGERLTDLVIRIGEMLAYQAYNIRSPLDGEAAMWADLHIAELPTDPRPLSA